MLKCILMSGSVDGWGEKAALLRWKMSLKDMGAECGNEVAENVKKNRNR